MHGTCRLDRFRSVLKCYSLWTKWALKFGSDDMNHSNFENAAKCLNKSWWYLLKHLCFILKLKDFCNTCVHFEWKKTNACRHDWDTVSACACVVCMTSAISWPNCVFAVASIVGRLSALHDGNHLTCASLNFTILILFDFSNNNNKKKRKKSLHAMVSLSNPCLPEFPQKHENTQDSTGQNTAFYVRLSRVIMHV